MHGLNLAIPEDAKAVIKPWDQREDTTTWVESGVDDQVRACHNAASYLFHLFPYQPYDAIWYGVWALIIIRALSLIRVFLAWLGLYD